LSAFIRGDELGDGFGAANRHFSSVSAGICPTSSNTIDKCYNGEGGCYSGAVSFPMGTPESPKGTAMSYCHVSSAGCGQNVRVFHPTHIAVPNNRIAANTPSCLTFTVDLIFANGFQ
jgi:hypothetical protein